MLFDDYIRFSTGFVLFVAEQNDVAHWVAMGRAFQRFGLTSTKLNISHAHVNMPCEEIEVRKKVGSTFRPQCHPFLLVRFGYSDKMPYSYSRSVHEVMMHTKKDEA
ncbi:MAG: hypothetical protein IPL46_20655 [Saprospiraceae bacterium]|nr:hypothetical protein [Saprospiraceae bacterium]